MTENESDRGAREVEARGMFARRMLPSPTEPGWYAYSGGRQTMVFHLDESGQWRVFMDNGTTDKCEWGYIEQALSVWDLVRIDVLNPPETLRRLVDQWGAESIRDAFETSWPTKTHVSETPYGDAFVMTLDTGTGYVEPTIRSKGPRLYISGTISSDPSLSYEQAKARFDAAKASLAALGYDPVSPVDMEGECGQSPEECVGGQKMVMPGQGQGNHSWECYLRGDIRAMLLCDGVALLPNWHCSTGARLEFNTAVACGLDVRLLEDWPPVEDALTEAARLVDGIDFNEVAIGYTEPWDEAVKTLMGSRGMDIPVIADAFRKHEDGGAFIEELAKEYDLRSRGQDAVRVEGNVPPNTMQRLFRESLVRKDYCGRCRRAEDNHAPGGSMYGHCEFVPAGSIRACNACDRQIRWDGLHWLDFSGKADMAGLCPASKDPDPLHSPWSDR